MDGWIKIHRSITQHWIWANNDYYKWWSDLLLMASWQDEKRLIGRKLIILRRGQLIASLSFLAKRWQRSIPTVISFLKMLQGDGMISKTSSHNISIIQIEKYEKYQDVYNPANEQTTLKSSGCSGKIDNPFDNPIYNPFNNPVDNPVYTIKEDKEENNTTTTIRARELEKLEADVMGESRMEQACMSLSISKETYKQITAEIIADWKFTDEPDINLKHFLTVMRYIVQRKRKANEDNTTNNKTQRRGTDTTATCTEDYGTAF